MKQHANREPHVLACSLIEHADWINAICDCRDRSAKRWALYACAHTMLPYWEARFTRDELMSNLVDLMAAAVRNPSDQFDAQLKAAIPNRRRNRGDMSIPSGFFKEDFSDCPADFAGDSVFHAARAFVNDPVDDLDDFFSLTSATECLARLFAERDTHHDDNKNYQDLAERHLRHKMVETISREAAGWR